MDVFQNSNANTILNGSMLIAKLHLSIHIMIKNYINLYLPLNSIRKHLQLSKKKAMYDNAK